MFHLKLLINFLSLSIAGQIDWHAFGKFIGSTGTALKPSGSPALLHQADPSCLLRVDTFCADSRTRGNSDRRAQHGLAGHRAWDLTSTQAFPSTPYYPRLTLLWCSSFLPFLVHNMRQPLYEVRSQHTCFLRKPPPLVYFERTLFHQPVVDFPFKHPNIYIKSGMAV